MPAGDHTGPLGQGPRTGRRKGRCNPSENISTDNQPNMAECRGGFGRGFWNRRGYGRRGFGFHGFGLAPALDQVTEKDES